MTSAAPQATVAVNATVSPVWLAVPVHRGVDPGSWAREAAADPPEVPPVDAPVPPLAQQADALASLLRLLRSQVTVMPLIHAWVLGGRHDRLPRAVVPLLALRGVTDLNAAVSEVLRLPPAGVEPPAVDLATDRLDRDYARIRQVVVAAGNRDSLGEAEPAVRAAVVTDAPARVRATRVTERFAACYPRPEAGLTVVASCLADDPVHAAAVESAVWHLLDALEIRVSRPGAGPD